MQITRSFTKIPCDHCGAECGHSLVRYHDHNFCCEGCRTVFELLDEKQLCEYYDLDQRPGLTPAKHHTDKWAFLDNPDLEKQLLQFRSGSLAIATLHIPGMHCTSCVYLLENLPRLSWGVTSAEVHFLKKELVVKYDPREIGLRKIVETLCAIGYTPTVNLSSVEKKEDRHASRQLAYRIGVAGFCFGNIMILSLPEYFDAKDLLTGNLRTVFRVLDAVLAIPVLAYCAQDYFKNAWYALKTRVMNMDTPIALGLGGLAVQSYYDVLSGQGGGYFDSISGLVLMLLAGKYLQSRTYEALSFDRDYRSYFPLAVLRRHRGQEESVKVTELQKGDEIVIHNEELIPADSLLEKGTAYIDYSFVTGESEPVSCHAGELLYAGGRNKGPRLVLKVTQEVSQSYLTRLWNQEAFRKEKVNGVSKWSNELARYFTVAVVAIALGTGIYWKLNDPSMLMRAVTSVLIVACPCVLALTLPFTFGGVLRVFGRNGLYLKDAPGIERLAGVDTIIFDKTGTLTEAQRVEIKPEGEPLTAYEKQLLAGLSRHSTHPLSRSISEAAAAGDEELNFPILNWEETVGQGLSARVDGQDLKLGKAEFAGQDRNGEKGATYFSLNGRLRGSFRIRHFFRNDLPQLALALRSKFNVYILSGDTDRDREELSRHFQPENLYFGQGPDKKMEFVEARRRQGHKVLMIGDGLNDAGALRAADFGITVTEDINSFTPASDAILDAKELGKLPRMVSLAQASKRIIYRSFIFSTLYNIIGLSFAVTGALQPWVAALLMPLSSITVVVYTHFSIKNAAQRRGL